MKTTYHISYKHQEHGSDTIGANFKTVAAAVKELRILESDPMSVGYAEWLKDAAMWVVDDNGNVHYEQ